MTTPVPLIMSKPVVMALVGLICTWSSGAMAAANRAAVQIQGSGVNNVSKAWDTDSKITGSSAVTAFTSLLSQQSATQKAKVDAAVAAAQKYVGTTCPAAGGCANPGKSGMTNAGVSGSVARADAPVFAGKAFQ